MSFSNVVGIDPFMSLLCSYKACDKYLATPPLPGKIKSTIILPSFDSI